MQRKLKNGRLNLALGECENALRFQDVIADSYKSASRTVVAQIQSE